MYNNFVLNINTNKYYKSDKYSIENNFDSVDSITMSNIKLYYLKLLANIDDKHWNNIYSNINSNKKIYHKSNIHFVTSDAHTLTGGPTIFLAELCK